MSRTVCTVGRPGPASRSGGSAAVRLLGGGATAAGAAAPSRQRRARAPDLGQGAVEHSRLAGFSSRPGSRSSSGEMTISSAVVVEAERLGVAQVAGEGRLEVGQALEEAGDRRRPGRAGSGGRGSAAGASGARRRRRLRRGAPGWRARCRAGCAGGRRGLPGGAGRGDRRAPRGAPRSGSAAAARRRAARRSRAPGPRRRCAARSPRWPAAAGAGGGGSRSRRRGRARRAAPPPRPAGRRSRRRCRWRGAGRRGSRRGTGRRLTRVPALVLDPRDGLGDAGRSPPRIAASSCSKSAVSRPPRRRMASSSAMLPAPKVASWSSRATASRTLPSPARAIKPERRRRSPRSPRPRRSCRAGAATTSEGTRRKWNSWQRERMVAGTASISVVAKMNTRWGGGSSMILSRASKAWRERRWISSITTTL